MRRRSTTVTARRLDAPSDVQADRHDQVQEAAAVAGLQQPWAQRADELQDDVAGVDRLEAVAQEVGVEADLELLAVERDGQRLARLADVRGLGRHRQLA